MGHEIRALGPLLRRRPQQTRPLSGAAPGGTAGSAGQGDAADPGSHSGEQPCVWRL